MNDICTIDRVPAMCRWRTALSRLAHNKPHLTLEEWCVLSSQADKDEQERQFDEADKAAAELSGKAGGGTK